MGNGALERAIYLLQIGVLSVDTEGRVWRHKTLRRGIWRDVPARRAENVGGKGYLRLTLQLPSGKLGSVQAHRAVWEWTCGPIPPGYQINHRDFNKKNNRPDNLEPTDQSGNILHSYANGRKRTRPWAHATKWRGKPRVDPKTEDRIVKLREEGKTLKHISAVVGVSISHIHRICARKKEVGE